MRVAMIEVVAIPQSRDRRYLTNQGFFRSLSGQHCGSAKVPTPPCGVGATKALQKRQRAAALQSGS